MDYILKILNFDSIQGWYQSLRAEVSDKNIDVTIVCPGPVKSNIIENAFTGTSGQVSHHYIVGI